jgi:hypothetical protein
MRIVVLISKMAIAFLATLHAFNMSVYVATHNRWMHDCMFVDILLCCYGVYLYVSCV